MNKMPKKITQKIEDQNYNLGIIYKSRKKRRWSYKFDRCEKCGTNEIEHTARGLCKNCYDRDIDKRHKDENRIVRRGEASSLLTAEYLLENYFVKKKSLGDIAKESNCSRQYVYKKMKAYGIYPRDKSSSREIALDKGKIIRENVSYDGKEQFVTLEKVILNENFFSSWSPEMAYVLGVIYTDGNLHPKTKSKKDNTNRVTITQKEPELLTKVLALMFCNATICYRKERIYDKIKAGAIYYFKLTHDKIYDDLVKLGLTPRKSLTMTFPDIPNQYVRHFVRGCWDGDGSIYFEKGSLLRAHFISGSFEFIKRIVEEFNNVGICQTRYKVSNEKDPRFESYYSKDKHPLKIYKNKHSESYYIRITTKKALERLFDYFYKDVHESMYLNRKYKLFAEGLGISLSDI